jgi:hypothetical protein
MGLAAPLLLVAVSTACAVAAVGLWRRRRWGYLVTVGLLCVQLLGDVVNVVWGREPRAVIGVPIVVALLLYLARPAVRGAFRSEVPSL